MKIKASIPRRQLLKSAAATAVTAPWIVPRSALGGPGFVAPSDKIHLGGIGIRNRGTKVLETMLPQPDVRFVAIADVRADRRSAVKQMADQQNGDDACDTYRDFRELLAREDIDAVLIATGDRWHAPISMMAAEAGKDVYSEKPCAITIDLAQRLADTIKRTGRVFQCGTQRRSISNFIHAIGLARSGKLGRLHTLHASIYKLQDRHDWLPAQPEPPKDEIDWNMWLGPAPWRPYNRAYVDGQWRGHYDFDSGAKLLDWGAHTLDLCQAAAGADDSGPIEFEPLDTEDDNAIQCRYADGLKLVLRRNGWLGLGTCPVRFEGDDGWVETGDSGRIAVSIDSLRAKLPDPTIAGTTPSTHTRNFLDCVKSRGKTNTNEDIMRKSHIACHAAAIAWKLGRKLTFDPIAEEFVGDDEANKMRSRAMREPWTV
ncbi:Glycosyl hydrolase [Rubripirellula tenax]|uniref:Glycosyl hydrolase n=1 Tax=Rubripirellula tenax TaxID=2528015 RepID=A0A5C6FKE9_9BACT|nr:Gfo/Idh/MocA family oxidoreductase [Rubripirellula tenax]TWU60487.1 Glycosyl hydrolase [Rubripirellula tenax]